MRGTKYRNVPAVLVTPEDVTQEVEAPMCSKSIPHTVKSAIESRDFVLIPVHAPGTEPLFAKVDRCDADRVSRYRWRQMVAPSSVYARRGYRESGKIVTVYMHTAIIGTPPDGAMVDHINGDGLDNRRANLRFVTQSQNSMNRRPVAGASGFKGVVRIKKEKPWMARIAVNGTRHYLGIFDTEVEAALAYDRAARKHFGEFARLNFPVSPERLS